MKFDEICASEHGRRGRRIRLTRIPWAFPVPQRESILKAMRAGWKAAQPEYKDAIVTLGQAVKAL
jgi:hypothetical protein